MGLEDTLAQLVYEALAAEIDKQAAKLKEKAAEALGVTP